MIWFQISSGSKVNLTSGLELDTAVCQPLGGPPESLTLYATVSQAGPARVSLASSSSLWPVRGFRWRDAGPRTREELPRCPPHPPPRAPPHPPREPTSRAGALARLQPEEVGSGRPPVPGRQGPRSPTGRSTWTIPRSKPRGAGESILWGGGEPWVWGRGVVGAVRGKPCTLSWIGARARCGLRADPGVPLLVAMAPAGAARAGVGLGVSGIPGPVLHPGLGLDPRALQRPSVDFQAEEILRHPGAVGSCYLAPSVSTARCCLSCLSVFLLNSDSQPAEHPHTH
ncbi:collagen alpha-1(II) chain-like [Symphalangus syndactylus]|uniref:collagen alpha-1(II) chain-like n=1 Tax=Symphalangus syndactylus TaxID=9590 RepID=UPI0030046A2F